LKDIILSIVIEITRHDDFIILDKHIAEKGKDMYVAQVPTHA
jgi:hypothetical protein